MIVHFDGGCARTRDPWPDSPLNSVLVARLLAAAGEFCFGIQVWCLNPNGKVQTKMNQRAHCPARVHEAMANIAAMPQPHRSTEFRSTLYHSCLYA